MKLLHLTNEITTSDNKNVAEKLNSFFIDAVDKLEIEPFLIDNSNNNNNNNNNVNLFLVN